VYVSPPTIFRLLKRFGITRKKLYIAMQICDVLPGAYTAHVFLARIYFHLGIDETDIAAITLVL